MNDFDVLTSIHLFIGQKHTFKPEQNILDVPWYNLNINKNYTTFGLGGIIKTLVWMKNMSWRLELRTLHSINHIH